MKQLKLSSKLIGGFLVMALLVLIGGSLGVTGMVIVNGILKDYVETRVPATRNLTMILHEQQNILSAESALFTPEAISQETEKEKLIRDIAASWNNADLLIRQYDLLPRTDEIDARWKNFQSAWQAWRKADSEWLEVIRQGNRDEALRIKISQGEDISLIPLKILKDLLFVHAESTKEAMRSGIGQGQLLTNAALIGTIVGIFLAICLGIYFVSAITRPVGHVIANLTQSVQQFAEVAGQIASSSNNLAEGTSKQSAAVQETYSVTEELKADNEKYAATIDKLKEMLGSTNAIGMNAFETMKKAKKSMKIIKQTSEETSSIAEAIEKIAFQTNLLALNASVEAARAGGVGSGFAVVSDDIRNLGASSTEAAKSSISLIARTIDISSRGNELIGLSIGKFVEYGTSAMSIYTYTNDAVVLAKKQLDGVNKINALIEKISIAAQANAAASEEASSLAEEISAQAVSVQTVVDNLADNVGYTGR